MCDARDEERGGEESHESGMEWGRCDQQQKVSVMEVGLITSELLKHHVGQASGKGGVRG